MPPVSIARCSVLADAAALAARLRVFVTDALDAGRDGAADLYDEAARRLDAQRLPGLGGPGALPDLTPEALAARIDHTALRPEAPPDAIDRLCREAVRHGFASVCVAPVYVRRATEALAAAREANDAEHEGAAPVVCTVIGFPHGNSASAVKAVAATHALNDGAAELDMVLPVGLLKAGRLLAVEADIRAVVEAARDAAEADEAREDVVVKVILETALLDAADIAVACVVAERAGADFVKTSTGFAEAGATLPDVALMRQMVGDALGVKAAGGIRTFEDARQMLAHGATRLGASASVALVEGASVEEEGY